jgi:hypothetical protein
MDVCRECRLFYGCVYSVLAIVWIVYRLSAIVGMCVQSVSFCVDVCTECRRLYGCVV